MVGRLDEELDLAAVTGFQRVMTSEMQENCSFVEEMVENPEAAILRMLQRFEFEVRSSK